MFSMVILGDEDWRTITFLRLYAGAGLGWLIFVREEAFLAA